MAYKIYGTGEKYTGRVVRVGDRYYATNGGALEGDMPLVVEDKQGTGTHGNELSNINKTTTNNTSTGNPMIGQPFAAPQSPRYYRPDGKVVPVGSLLHRHEDGTIMTNHTRTQPMGDRSVVVTSKRPTTRSRRSQVRSPQANRVVGGNGRNTGGNMGGGGGY